MAQKNLSYLQAYQELQLICDRIKEESIPIEELPNEIKKAKKLVSYCENLLRAIESELDETKEA
ncbi:MAG: exodeoxyribonuclease VII small subunit [Saprospiraceae bacterium]|nr:exodeoxyribonuclease VII small subunit [Saprospiraceae bacterium]MBK8449767.1 exodeoxyribonuclease VII small subunit [Saprospiraceae bacterium]MBK8484166.1 exodeoxyribonuclease VII small subunit [Saprospiraceae bacterium]MBK9221569.1 exodeoxyribonuclease VII small subunit [Saprospiraceae bacterium]MBK9721493.1 exodeoxyribonuclease VII small subunit [Saprospiraceae bacterium]